MYYKDNIKDFSEATKLNDKNDIYWNIRGFSNFLLKKFEDSIKDYSEAIELNDKNAVYWNNRGDSKF